MQTCHAYPNTTQSQDLNAVGQGQNALNQPAPQPEIVVIAANVQYTPGGQTPDRIERATVAFKADGSILITNRAGIVCRLELDAAMALAITLKDKLLTPVKAASFGSKGMELNPLWAGAVK